MLKIKRINDSQQPQVGIYEYLGDQLLILSDDVDLTKAVGGMVEMRELFHQDLMRMAVNYPLIDPNIKRDIEKNNFKVWRFYPRGRVCYQVNEDQYYIFGAVETLRKEDCVNELISEFKLPKNKVQLVADPEYEIIKR